MSVGPRDPTKPSDPLVIPRRRPQSVTLAGALLYGGGALGGLAAVALLVGSGSVVDDFQTRAIGLGVTGADAADVATVLRSALLSSGCGALALAMLSFGLGWGVLARYEAARIGALVVTAVSLGCGLVRTSVTAFGRSVDWALAAGNSDPLITYPVAQAFAEAMPGWLVGLGGGLTDLQSLSYIAVAALLIAPASREYFHTRIY